MKILKNAFISLLCLVFSSQIYGKNVMLNFGGVGDFPGKRTTFDPYLNSLYYFKQKANWDIRFNYDGDHTETTSDIKTFFTPENPKFTPKNFSHEVEELIAKINRGEILAGDQLMLNHLGHGGDRYGYQTHYVAAIPDESDPKKQGLSLDILIPLFEAARAHNVKLALFDASCFSGGTQKLAELYPEACVISSTTSENLSYAEFHQHFFKGMVPGKNLEDLFLESREQTIHPSMPLISGSNLANSIAESETIWTYNTGIGSHGYDMFYTILQERIKLTGVKDEMTNCQSLDIGMNLAVIDQLKDFILILSKKDVSATTEEMKQTMKEFNLINGQFFELQKQKESLGAKVEEFEYTEKGETKMEKLTWNELADADYPRALHDIDGEKLTCARTSSCAAVNEKEIAIKRMQKLTDELKTKPEFNEIIKLKALQDELKEKTVRYSKKFVSQERALYRALHDIDNANLKGVNPCQKFIL